MAVLAFNDGLYSLSRRVRHLRRAMVGVIGLFAAGCVTTDAQPLVPAAVSNQGETERSETFRFSMHHNDRAEVEVSAKAGDTIAWVWSVTGGTVGFRVYGPASSQASDGGSTLRSGDRPFATGTITAPFAASYGWTWFNHMSGPVTITLKITGRYESVLFSGVHPRANRLQ